MIHNTYCFFFNYINYYYNNFCEIYYYNIIKHHTVGHNLSKNESVPILEW